MSESESFPLVKYFQVRLAHLQQIDSVAPSSPCLIGSMSGGGRLSDRQALGSVNIPLAWAMFGGSTFLLFLLCYCCQKKLREDSLSLDDGEISHDRSHLHQIHVISGSTIPSQTYQAIPSSPSPPPAYDSVIKKDPYVFDQSPPPYEIAMANLRSGGFV